MVGLLSIPASRCWLLAILMLSGCAISRPQQQRIAAEWIESNGGRVVYDHHQRNLKPVDVWYTEGTEEELQWKSRLPDDTWLAKTLGPHYAYRIHSASFNHTNFQGIASPQISTKGMKELHFSGCVLSDELFVAIGKCSDLETLYLFDCRLPSDSCLANLSSAKKLKDLAISNTSLPASGLTHIGKCYGLELLDLTSCEFDATQLDQLQGLTRLRHCGLGDTPVGDAQLGVLRHWPNLRRLELGSKVTDEALVEVGMLETIEDLVFMKSNVTDAGMEHIIRLPRLRSLQMSGCQVSDEMWARIAQEHPGLGGGYVR